MIQSLYSLLRDLALGPPSQPRAALGSILVVAATGSLAVALLTLLSQSLDATLLLGSFGASCVLLFGYPDSPFSRSRNVILGHFLTVVVGLLFTHVCGPTWWSLSLALGVSIALMMLTRTVHPPAGSNPVIVYLLSPGWNFAIFPTLAGAVLLVVLAWTFRRLKRG